MSALGTQTGSLGWFGKIPALGDFVVRRLPQRFVQPWDEWLAKELFDAAEEWADAWPALYRRAPITCFSLSAGVLDEHTWCGVLVPSFDRVGREFPLTIAQSRLSTASGMPSQRRQTMCVPSREWWSDLVAAGRSALEPGRGPKELDDALTAMREVEPAVPLMADGQSVWWHWPEDEPARALVSHDLPRGAGFRRLFVSLP
jgi:type VI secretion system protein ImpM